MSRSILMHKRIEVMPGMRLWVPQYITYSDFGVREYDARHHRHHHHSIAEGVAVKRNRGRFICSGVPGTGFFEQVTESDAYEQMVRHYAGLRRTGFWKHLLKKEFSFKAEIAAANKALRATDDTSKRMILESYVNSLLLAEQAEELERVVLALKKKMHKGQNKALRSAANHYRTRITQLESEMNVCKIKVEDLAEGEQLEAYKEFCKTFESVMSTRRVWTLRDDGKKMEMKRVFCDFGVFDYMCTDEGTPLLRDADGTIYYLFPNYMVRARSTVDFDVVPLKESRIVYREASGEAFSLNRSSGSEIYGRSLGEVYFANLEQSFYFAHRSVAGKLVHAIHEYQRKSNIDLHEDTQVK